MEIRWWAPQEFWQPPYYRGRSHSCPSYIIAKDDRPGLDLAQRPGTLEGATQADMTEPQTHRVPQTQADGIADK